jgi:hypothetical protein
MVRFEDVVRDVKETVDRESTHLTRFVAGDHMDSDDIHLRRWGEINGDYLGPAFHRGFRKGQVLYGSRRTYLKKVAVAPFDGNRFLEHPDLASLLQETYKDLKATPDPPIARQFLTSSSAFKRRKAEFFATTGDDMLAFPIRLNLPHFVWVTEISSLGLHNKRQCFGEIVVDATVGPREWEPVYARIGRYLMAGSKKQRDNGSPLSYSQYTHNLGRL